VLLPFVWSMEVGISFPGHFAGRFSLLQIAIAGGDDPHVRGNFPVSAQAIVLGTVQYAEQFHL